MASRRIKSTVNNQYTQPLKLRMGRKLLLTPGVTYNSVLFTQKHVADNQTTQSVFLWAKFNTNTFDGIQMIAWLENKNKEETSSGSCEFKVYYLDASNNWNKTLIFTGSGSSSGNKWIASPNQAALGINNDLDGERTLLIEATLTKWGDTYTDKIYVNHLGIYDSFTRLKNDVDFLDISKQDI
jgi:hypothetical protein